MSYCDDFYDDYNEFEEITYSPDVVEEIDNVSKLRHYMNCHGYTNQLRKYVGEELYHKLDQVCTYCFGSTDIFDLKKNADTIIESAKRSRQNKEDALIKNEELIYDREDKKENMCKGLGFKKVKLLLNKLIKLHIPTADLLRAALELEDINIKAKDCFGWVKDATYKRKEELLIALVNLAIDNEIIYGYQKSENYSTSYVVYFEIPGCEQLSWHTSDSEYAKSLPLYTGVWDGKQCSTLLKLENAILNLLYSNHIIKVTKFQNNAYIKSKNLSFIIKYTDAIGNCIGVLGLNNHGELIKNIKEEQNKCSLMSEDEQFTFISQLHKFGYFLNKNKRLVNISNYIWRVNIIKDKIICNNCEIDKNEISIPINNGDIIKIGKTIEDIEKIEKTCKFNKGDIIKIDKEIFASIGDPTQLGYTSINNIINLKNYIINKNYEKLNNEINKFTYANEEEIKFYKKRLCYVTVNGKEQILSDGTYFIYRKTESQCYISMHPIDSNGEIAVNDKVYLAPIYYFKDIKGYNLLEIGKLLRFSYTSNWLTSKLYETPNTIISKLIKNNEVVIETFIYQKTNKIRYKILNKNTNTIHDQNGHGFKSIKAAKNFIKYNLKMFQ